MAVQGHDFLGKASVDLAALLNERPDAKAIDSMWLPLLNRKGAKGKGELRIGLEFLSAAQAQQVGSQPVSRVPAVAAAHICINSWNTCFAPSGPGCAQGAVEPGSVVLAAAHCLCVLAGGATCIHSWCVSVQGVQSVTALQAAA